MDFQSIALPTELRHQLKEGQKYKNFNSTRIFFLNVEIQKMYFKYNIFVITEKELILHPL